jgi:hypothetical protein
MPSSPILPVMDEDNRLRCYIISRTAARPTQALEFERAAHTLANAGVGFTDLPTLSEKEWDSLQLKVGIKKDLLKWRKKWHREHPERRKTPEEDEPT